MVKKSSRAFFFAALENGAEWGTAVERHMHLTELAIFNPDNNPANEPLRL